MQETRNWSCQEFEKPYPLSIHSPENQLVPEFFIVFLKNRDSIVIQLQT